MFNKEESLKALSDRALELTTNLLAKHNNEVSADHRKALLALCRLAFQLTHKMKNGRYSFPLPCGMGKSTAIRCIIQAIHESGHSFRVVVASSKVEELCQLKRDLINCHGVHPDRIGLIHSYEHKGSNANASEKGFASEPSGNHGAQFMLLTHKKFRSGTDRYLVDADLIFFDESLIVGEPETVSVYRPGLGASLLTEIALLRSHASDMDSDLKPAVGLLGPIFEEVCKEFEAPNVEGKTFSLAGYSREDAERAIEMLGCLRSRIPNVIRVLEWITESRVVKLFKSSSDWASLLSYRVSVPDSVSNIIVLDASYPIRYLAYADRRACRFDYSLSSKEPLYGFDAELSTTKNYKHVQVYHAVAGGGRSTFEASLKRGTEFWPAQKLAKLVVSKSSEAFLVVTHKQRAGAELNIPREVRRALAKAGVAADDLIDVDGISVPRVSFLTWGNETGANQFSQYRNVVLLGVMIPPADAVAATYLGQVDEIGSERVDIDFHDMVSSECRHMILQAMNRGSMRRTRVEDGKSQAEPCSIYIWHNDRELEDRMRRILPGAPKWKPWLVEGETIGANDVAFLVREVLDEYEFFERPEISCRALKKEIGVRPTDSTFKRGRDLALSAMPRWHRDGAMIRYIPF